MLFDSSLRKELARTFGATLVVLVTVVMTMMLIRTLGQASRGNVSPSDVLLVMGYTVLGQLPTILSLSLFVATIGSLSRMYKDSEMVIWFSSGQGLASLLPPLLRFSWPVILAVTALSLVVWPWANQQIQELRDQYEQRGDVDRIAPGEFQESASGNRVFFIDRQSREPDAASNVFIAANERGTESVTSARSARIETRGEDRFALLSNGQRLERTVGNPETKLSEFDLYGTLVGTARSAVGDEGAAKTRSTRELAAQAAPVYRAELAWRLGLIFAAFNLMVLGLGLASVNPRASRSGNLMFALFAFIIYYNFMTLGQSWVESGRVGLSTYMVVLHGGVFAFAAAVIAIRHHRWSLRSFFARGISA